MVCLSRVWNYHSLLWGRMGRNWLSSTVSGIGGGIIVVLVARDRKGQSHGNSNGHRMSDSNNESKRNSKENSRRIRIVPVLLKIRVRARATLIYIAWTNPA